MEEKLNNEGQVVGPTYDSPIEIHEELGHSQRRVKMDANNVLGLETNAGIMSLEGKKKNLASNQICESTERLTLDEPKLIGLEEINLEFQDLEPTCYCLKNK